MVNCEGLLLQERRGLKFIKSKLGLRRISFTWSCARLNGEFRLIGARIINKGSFKNTRFLRQQQCCNLENLSFRKFQIMFFVLVAISVPALR